MVASFIYNNALRNIELRLIIRKAESRGHNADDFAVAHVDRDLFSDDVGTSAKQMLPGTVAQYDVARFVGPILARAERSAQQRYGSQRAEEICRDGEPRNLQASLIRKQVHRQAYKCRHRLEGMVALSPCDKIAQVHHVWLPGFGSKLPEHY